MIWLSLILLAGSSHVELVNDVFHLPPGERRLIELGLKQRPALVAADFETDASTAQVRLALMRREDLGRTRSDLPMMAATAAGSSGHIRYRVRTPGDYVVVIENGGNTHAVETRLRVALDFQMQSGPEVTRLSPLRQFVVIVISFAVFFAIVSYSARRLLRGIRH
jgi:hypothetical protein